MPFIYGLVDPLEPEHLRYVGVATRSASRPYSHAKQANANPSTCAHKWILELQNAGRGYTVVILREFPDETEKSLIIRAEKNFMISAARAGHQLLNYNERWAADEFNGKHFYTRDIIIEPVIILKVHNIPIIQSSLEPTGGSGKHWAVKRQLRAQENGVVQQICNRESEEQRLAQLEKQLEKQHRQAEKKEELRRGHETEIRHRLIAREASRRLQYQEKQNAKDLHEKQNPKNKKQQERTRGLHATPARDGYTSYATKLKRKAQEKTIYEAGMAYGQQDDDLAFVEHFVRHSRCFR